MPEGHAIGRIDAGHGVIAPATPIVGLIAVAIEHCSFPLTQVTWRVTDEASSITNSRERVGIGYRIADSRVAVVIHGNAGHPSPESVIVISPGLLLHRRGWKRA